MPNSEYRKISVLISKEISGIISPEEKKELTGWRKKTIENEHLYRELHSSKRFGKWESKRKSVDVNAGWEKVLPEIQKIPRIRTFSKLVRIAAIFMLPIICGGLIYLYQKQKNSHQEYVNIQPGSSKAVLVLGDGRNMVLDSLQTLSLTETDGTQIKKREGEIVYSTPEVKKKRKNIVYNTITVPRGGEYKLTLSDGTKVHLNSMTTLKYPVQFAEDKRKVELTGEAYFEVTKNAQKPFVVNTGKVGVEVLGTSFNVNAYGDARNTVTTLVEGKVKITHSEHKFDDEILLPGEQAVMDNSTGQINLREVNVALYTSWKNGRFVFYDMPLEDIMDILTRWYSAKVFYMNPEVKKIRFSGNLCKYDEIGKFVDIIEATQQVNIQINNKTILFALKKDGKKN